MMAGPWEQYQTQDSGPWAQYQSNTVADQSAAPVKIGADAFADTLKEELKNTDWGTRNIASLGSGLVNAYEGLKQFVGKGNKQQIEAQRLIRDAAPVGAIAGDVAMTAIPFGLAGNSVRAAGAVGAGFGALQPVEGEQTLGNVASGKLANTALGGVMAAGGQAVANKVSDVVARNISELATKKSQNAQRDATLKAAQEMGFVVPPDQVNPSFMNRVLTGFAGKLTTQQQASAKNQEVINAAARRYLGLADDVPLSDDMLNAFRKANAGPYKELSAMGDLPIDEAYNLGKKGPQVFGKSKPGTAFVDDMGNIVENVPKMPKPEMQRNLLDEVIKAGGVSKAELSDIGIEQVKRPGLFRKEGSGMTGDDLVEFMVQRGWMNPQDVKYADDNLPGGAIDAARQMLKEAIEGRPPFHPSEDDLAYAFGQKLSDWGAQYGHLKEVKIPGDPGKVNAADAVENLKDLRYQARSYWQFFNRNGDPSARQKASALDKAADSLENFLERASSNAGKKELVPALRNARKEIAKAHTVGKALNDATGNVNARVLGREKYLTGDLKTAADFAKAFPKAAQPVEQMGALPGISPLDFVGSAMMGGAGAAAAGPGGLVAAGVPFVRPVARSLLLSKAYQNAMANPSYSLGFTPRIGNALVQYAPIGMTVGSLNALSQ